MFEVMLGGGASGSKVEGMFIREVPASEFITGDVLASQIGLTAGTSQHSDAGWLKFADGVDGKTKYISKKPLRHSISWNHINAVGAVFGSANVSINGGTYKVRLLSGANTNPSTTPNGSFDRPGTHGTEWNRLLYRVSAGPFADMANTLASEGISTGDWAQYTEIDLLPHRKYGNGSYSWCQETGTTGDTRVGRGYVGVSNSAQSITSDVSAYTGWRPVLELVE